jgi:hypothetical protein
MEEDPVLIDHVVLRVYKDLQHVLIKVLMELSGKDH